MKKIFIIIVTHNAMRWIAACLRSCDAYPVVVVDNNSTDGTVSYIQENFPDVVVLPQQKNLGFGQGNNVGIRYAMDQEADYFFLLNQDAYLQAECITTLLAVQQEFPEFGILSPIHYNGQASAIDANFMLYLKRYGVAEKLLHDAFKDQLARQYAIDFVNAAAWFVSKSCVTKVGGFDPLFFHYGEDRNYCQRVAYKKFKIGIVPEASVLHDRENRIAEKPEKYTESYYSEFERYLKVDWADINSEMFEKKYDARSRNFLSKQRRHLLAFNFKKALDSKRKRNIMLRLKPEIRTSREVNKNKEMPYL